MVNVIEINHGVTITASPFSFEEAYKLRDWMQATALSAGFNLNQYRYAIRLVD